MLHFRSARTLPIAALGASILSVGVGVASLAMNLAVAGHIRSVQISHQAPVQVCMISNDEHTHFSAIDLRGVVTSIRFNDTFVDVFPDGRISSSISPDDAVHLAKMAQDARSQCASSRA